MNKLWLSFPLLASLVLPVLGQDERPSQTSDKSPPSATPALAAGEPELIGSATFEYMAEFKVRNVPQGTAVIWDVFPDDPKTITRIIKVEKSIIICGPPREYSVKVRLVKGEDFSEFKRSFRIVGGLTPPPFDPLVPIVPPLPPTPVPPIPVPPLPIEPKILPPIPEAGFRVLIVYQDTLKARYSQAQKDLIFGDEFREYVRTKAVIGADGRTPEVRIWDVDVKGVENETLLWQKAFARPRLVNIEGRVVDAVASGYIWVVVSNGKEGWEGPVGPTDAYAEVFARIKKIGG